MCFYRTIVSLYAIGCKPSEDTRTNLGLNGGSSTSELQVFEQFTSKPQFLKCEIPFAHSCCKKDKKGEYWHSATRKDSVNDGYYFLLPF